MIANVYSTWLTSLWVQWKWLIYLFIYLFICLFTYFLIYLNLFTVQPRYHEVQGNRKRAVLYGLVKLMFDLAYSRCCIGGSDNHFGFVEFICAHSLCYSFTCTVADLQGFVTFNIVFLALASVSLILELRRLWDRK